MLINTMKTSFTLLLIGLLSCLSLNAQCDTTYITTNPDVPYNPENPAKLNIFFDWRTEEYDLNYTVNGQPISTSIPSPFYQIDNQNVSYLYLSEDFRPEEGWELIARNLGFSDDGTPLTDLTHPYLLLYNKYNGLLRVFLVIGERDRDYDEIELGVRFSLSGGNKRTALFAYAHLLLQAVQEFDTVNVPFVRTSTFLHEEKNGSWVNFR